MSVLAFCALSGRRMNHPPSTATHTTGTIHFQFLRKKAAALPPFAAGFASPAAVCCTAASCFFLKIMLAVSSCIFQGMPWFRYRAQALQKRAIKSLLLVYRIFVYYTSV